MEYIRLGRTGLKVSRLCLGTMNFGWSAGEAASHEMLSGALDHGLNFVDTSNSYGGQFGAGLTEQIIGGWFAKGGPRDKVVLATKVYSRMGEWPNEGGLSARNIVAACEASLRRLGTEWIDLYQMHHVDRDVPWEEIWQAMELLVAQGKVRYVGSSNFAGWHLAAAQAAADRRHFLGLVSEQCMYNLLTRHVELEVLPAAAGLGLGVLPWSPLHRGLLSGAVRKERDGVPGREPEGRSRALAQHRPAIEAYEDLCADLGLEPSAVALAWLLARPEVTAPIIGPRTAAQLYESLPALDLTLGRDVLDRLDEIFPPIGKGGPAPEAWAW
ncbi:aldo/keto reductase [Longispora albida]|uniref:aldo/keto reductase n=1 Tax=Longispora albida TaxID=203523 RepID=UPI00037EE92C|nr:aldo/keto reductase [Longispora albida]